MSLLSALTIPVELLLPPTGLAVLALVVALAPPRRRGRQRRAVLVALLGLLVVLGMPAVADPLIASLDPGPASPADAAAPAPGAIVILSAELVRTRDPDGHEVGPMTLERERAGAALARRTGLPVLVTGGVVDRLPPLAWAMRDSMAEDFGVPVRWTEAASTTTWENARFSAPILAAAGVRRVYLVTHAWHMRRSLLAFRRAGLDPVAAPVRLDAWPRGTWSDLVPRVAAWQRSWWAMHEWVGLAWYAMRP